MHDLHPHLLIQNKCRWASSVVILIAEYWQKHLMGDIKMKQLDVLERGLIKSLKTMGMWTSVLMGSRKTYILHRCMYKAKKNKNKGNNNCTEVSEIKAANHRKQSERTERGSRNQSVIYTYGVTNLHSHGTQAPQNHQCSSSRLTRRPLFEVKLQLSKFPFPFARETAPPCTEVDPANQKTHGWTYKRESANAFMQSNIFMLELAWLTFYRCIRKGKEEGEGEEEPQRSREMSEIKNDRRSQ